MSGGQISVGFAAPVGDLPALARRLRVVAALQGETSFKLSVREMQLWAQAIERTEAAPPQPSVIVIEREPVLHLPARLFYAFFTAMWVVQLCLDLGRALTMAVMP